MDQEEYAKYKQRREARLKKRKDNRGHFMKAVKVLICLVVLCIIGIGGYRICGYFFNNNISTKNSSPLATSAVPTASTTATQSTPAPSPAKPAVTGDVKNTNGPHNYSILIIGIILNLGTRD
jgi:uncharacterized protein (UPF0333 family)